MTTATRNEVRRGTTALSKLYGERLVKGSKKDTSFQYLTKKGETVTVRVRSSKDSPDLVAELYWEDGASDLYTYEDLESLLTKAPAVEENIKQAEARRAEREVNRKQAPKRKKRVAKPKAPASKKERKPREAALGQGGRIPTDAEYKKIVSEITKAHKDHPFRRNGLIHLLIVDHDLSNETIVEIFEDYFEELLPCDQQTVAKARRALLRKQKNS